MNPLNFNAIFKNLLVLLFCLGWGNFIFGQIIPSPTLPPVISTQPISTTVCLHTPHTFSVTQTGGTSFQWRFNGTNISGATATSYTINSVSIDSAGYYSVVVTNSGGSTSSLNAFLNFSFNNQSTASTIIGRGYSNTFFVQLNDSTNNIPTYQWFNDAGAIQGAVQSYYTASTAGNYHLNVYSTATAASAGCVLDSTIAANLSFNENYYFNNTIGNNNINDSTHWDLVGDGTGSKLKNFQYSQSIYHVRGNAVTAKSLVPGSSLDFAMKGTLNLLSDSLQITAGSTFTVDNITQTLGTLLGSSTSNLFVTGNADLYFGRSAQTLQNLTIAGTGTSNLNTHLAIASSGILTLNNGTFSTNDSLTLKSDANNTAAIGTSSSYISGKVTIERYIPARRAWRLMTASVASSGAPTINAAWQEGVVDTTSTDIENPHPGYGTNISGNGTSNGFDLSTRNSSGLKYYDGSNLVGVANTNKTLITAYPGYFFFIRGDRSASLFNAVSSPTTLRATGNLNQGIQNAISVPSDTSKYTLVGNPYACPISFSKVIAASTGIKNRFYIWNPELSGTNGLGSYVIIDYNGIKYTSTPTMVSVDSMIQSGQAFFIQGSGTQGTLTINEGCKSPNTASTTTNSNVPFGRVATTQSGRVAGLGDASISVDLKIVNADGTVSIADGVLAHYNDLYSNLVTSDDAAKFYNGGENMFITNPTQALTIERRQMPLAGDTLNFNITGFKNTNYQLKINSDFLYTGFQTQVVDKFLAKTINVSDTLTYPFAVTSDANSTAANRFSVVFNALAVLPIRFLSVNATTFNTDSININWTVTDDANTIRYEVQRLNDNNIYTTIGLVNATANGSAAGYQLKDIGLFGTTIFYRIKAITVNGEVFYSTIASVKFKSVKEGISIWPNPVTGNTIMVAMQNVKSGKFNYTLLNNAGQSVTSGSINHTTNQPILTLQLNEIIAAGNYVLLLNQGNISYKTNLVIIR